MKRCNECSQLMPPSAFSVCRAAPDGLQWKCKVCAAARQNRIYHESADARERKARTWQLHRANKAEEVRASKRAYYEANKERWAAWGAARASRMGRLVPWADKGLIADIYAYARVMRSSGVDCHVDHQIPLNGKTVSGLHVHDNLTVLPAFENLRKGNRFEAGV